MLRPGGVLITPDAVHADQLPNKKTLNVALLGRAERAPADGRGAMARRLARGLCGELL